MVWRYRIARLELGHIYHAHGSASMEEGIWLGRRFHAYRYCMCSELAQSEWFANISSQVLFSVTAALCIVCTHYGSGQFARNVPPLTMAKGIKVCPSSLLPHVQCETDWDLAFLHRRILLCRQRYVHQD
jgi:hypothetical protein